MASTYRNLNGQTTGVNVKASKGALIGWFIINAAASTRYVKLYDKSTAPSASDTPLVTIQINATSYDKFFLADNEGERGIAFQNGLGVRASTGLADNDNTAPSSNDVLIHLFYR